MQYCPDCQRMLSPDAADCGNCGGALRTIEINDPVLLVCADPLKSALIEPLLSDLQIPYSKVGSLGAAFTMRGGNLLETFCFYVPYGAYPQAHDVLLHTLGRDPDIRNAL